jgi:hypothetical protein
MNAASLPHAKLMKAIEMLGTRVAPALREVGGGKEEAGGGKKEASSVPLPASRSS